ncbi:MAG: potassium channel family protein [Planctomycetota bacterium]|jgi:voltage-gated potassium channel
MRGSNYSRLMWSLVLLTSVLVFGTTGYALLTGGRESVWKCLYMTAITITTVGYEDVLKVNAGPAGATFTIVLLFLGLGVLLYTVSVATAFVVEGDLTETLRRRKMENRIAGMDGHYIICGAGETGLRAAAELVGTGRAVVAIDLDAGRIERLSREFPDVPHLRADASEDQVLLAAGVERARGLVSALPEDRDNLFVALSARRLNPDLRIVARAVEERTVPKLRTAGADAVVSPNQIGGLRMASELIRPGTVSFLDTMLRGPGAAVRFEDVTVVEGSDLAGKTLAEANLTGEAEVLVVAVREPGVIRFLYGPPAGTRLTPGMTLVLLGRSEEVLRLYERHGLEPPGRGEE